VFLCREQKKDKTLFFLFRANKNVEFVAELETKTVMQSDRRTTEFLVLKWKEQLI
jgi:hypothetical protein